MLIGSDPTEGQDCEEFTAEREVRRVPPPIDTSAAIECSNDRRGIGPRTMLYEGQIGECKWFQIDPSDYVLACNLQRER